MRKTTDSLRILGNGELKVSLTVRAHHFSASAKSKIEAAGGKTELLVNANSKDRKAAKEAKKAAKKGH